MTKEYLAKGKDGYDMIPACPVVVSRVFSVLEPEIRQILLCSDELQFLGKPKILQETSQLDWLLKFHDKFS